MNIRIKPLKINEKNLEIDETKKELDIVQQYFDKHEFALEKDSIDLVILKGIYDDNLKSMRIISVFVNSMSETIVGLKCTLRFQLEREKIQFAKLSLKLPPDVFGELKTGEGVLVYLDVPVRGLYKNQEFNGSILKAAFTDVEYLKING